MSCWLMVEARKLYPKARFQGTAGSNCRSPLVDGMNPAAINVYCTARIPWVWLRSGRISVINDIGTVVICAPGWVAAKELNPICPNRTYTKSNGFFFFYGSGCHSRFIHYMIVPNLSYQDLSSCKSNPAKVQFLGVLCIFLFLLQLLGIQALGCS